MPKDNTRPCSGTSGLWLLLSRPRPSENFVQESNIILGSHTFSEFHSMSGLYGTRYPPYVRRARQDFTLNRLEILVISPRTNVCNTQIHRTQIRRLNFCRFCCATLLGNISDNRHSRSFREVVFDCNSNTQLMEYNIME